MKILFRHKNIVPKIVFSPYALILSRIVLTLIIVIINSDWDRLLLGHFVSSVGFHSGT